jgi:hypothetical protein
LIKEGEKSRTELVALAMVIKKEVWKHQSWYRLSLVSDYTQFGNIDFDCCDSIDEVVNEYVRLNIGAH